MKKKTLSGNADFPAVSPLLLNNEVFTQKQNNILNKESMLILDTSAIDDMGNKIAGTESMNLLINNWRNVAGSGDTFRNFACNDADLMLTKTQKSINDIDEANANSIGINTDFSSGKAAILVPGMITTEITPTFFSLDGKPETDPYDYFGKYGGDQRDLGAGEQFLFWVIKENDDVYDLVKSKEGFKDYSRLEILDLLERISVKGCSFTAMANAIFHAYIGRPEEFEKVFGFPMVGKDGDLNYSMLIVDIFLETVYTVDLSEVGGPDAFKAIYKDPENIDIFNKNYNKNCKTIEEVQATCDQMISDAFINGNTIIPISRFVSTNKAEFANRFATYCKKRGIDSYTYEASSEIDKSEIERQLKEGRTVVISTLFFKLENEEGENIFEQKVPASAEERKKVSGHAMVVTGIAPDGRLIVSSWGKKYYLDLNDQVSDFKVNSIRYIDIKPSPNTISPQDSKLYDDIGTYGGRAPGSLKENYTQVEIMNIMKRYPGYANCTEKDITKATDRFRRLGSSYVPMANSLFEYYQGHQKEFEEKFNIPMVNAKGDLNVDLLAFMIFLETDKKVYFDEPEGLDCCTDYILDYYNKNPDVYKINHNKALYDEKGNYISGMGDEVLQRSKDEAQIYKDIMAKSNMQEMTFPDEFDSMSDRTFGNRFSHFCKEHGVNMTLKTLEKTTKSTFSPDNAVKSALERGEQLVCSYNKSLYIMDDRGEKVNGFYEERSNMMTIMGITKLKNGDDAYVVSCAGKKYYIYPDAAEKIYSIKYNA